MSVVEDPIPDVLALVVLTLRVRVKVTGSPSVMLVGLADRVMVGRSRSLIRYCVLSRESWRSSGLGRISAFRKSSGSYS